MKTISNHVIIFFLFTIVYGLRSNGQVPLDSIKLWRGQLSQSKDDQSRLVYTTKLAFGYRFSNVDSSLYFNNLSLKYSQDLGLPYIESSLLSLRGATLLENGRLPESLHFQFEALNKSIAIRDTNTMAFALNRIGNTYMELGNYSKANEYYFQSWHWFETIQDSGMVYNEMTNIGNVHELSGNADSALYYQVKVYEGVKGSSERNKVTRPELMFRLGNAYKLNKENDQAIKYYKMGIDEALTDRDLRNLTMNNLLLAKVYLSRSQFDSCRKYAYQALNTAKIMPFTKGIFESATIISDLFARDNRFDSAYAYKVIADNEKENLTGTKRLLELQSIVLGEQEKQRTTEAERIAEQNRQRQFLLISGIGIILLITIFLYRNNRQKQKTNTTLHLQKKKIETTLEQLKATQSQLIQSEKMASLGELTAGIAHEIQNPLNFVNNFSDVNKELIEELNTERLKPAIERNEQLEDEIINDIKDNSEKINHHGKRAESIVNGMLQHSRTSSGHKEPTDINALCEEYLRVVYHGLKAKDKSFNAEIKTDFDNSIGKIDVVSQNIGRVFLNLINNAFYAVNEKAIGLMPNTDRYEPTVTVSTKKGNGIIEICVIDNGNGIPGSIKEKIFQPFFTTKPTGQGTGLGLSLSYDIIKAHGGSLNVISDPGNGANFIIQLPY